ncbi:phytosulfokine receptor 2 [Amborella trichopoda]|nr:phytosulfokine receptor 2 [Amborella trichopoda]|eukprot:XP_006849388.2 phytosulfokine receptor 2 [Amborella trichopoda]
MTNKVLRMGFSLLVWILLVPSDAISITKEREVNQTCDPNDSQALLEFVETLSNNGLLGWSHGSNCCSWKGVYCDPNLQGNGNSSKVARVKKLALRGLSLKGVISGSLGRLDQLQYLILSFNLLEGELPQELSNLQNLEVLDLSYNMLRGSVLPLIGLKSIRSLNISSNLFNGSLVDFRGYPNLTVFNISSNSFTGPIVTNICRNSAMIQVMDLSENRFSGELKLGLGNCTSLRELYMGFNALAGRLPYDVFTLLSLKELSIPANNFFGRFSERVSNLSSLVSLVIFGNRFFGPLPDVFGNLTKLEQLIAHSNSFTGTLPASLSLCSLIKVVDLRNNSLSGTIDLLFEKIPHLSSLDLATNRFNGELPASLSNCKELKTLSLARNNLVGQVPESYGNLQSLSLLSLSNNSFQNISRALDILHNCGNLTTLILTKNFNGERIPVGISGFNSLMVFALGNCGLWGEIPDWLQECRKLQVLDLSWNRLSGGIPPWIGTFEYLFYLDVSNNSLTREVPKSLTQLQMLVSANTTANATLINIPLYVKRNKSSNGMQYNQVSSFPPALYLSNNRLNGMIWPEFGQLKGLHILDLSRNNITGTIPDTISNMVNLELLDLSYNELNGSIPMSLCNLTFLSKFSVAHNYLEGEIPDGGQFFSFSNSSFEGNLGLCGSPLPSCQRSPAFGLEPSGPTGRTNRSGILGITLSIGLGIALLLATLLLHMSRKEERYQSNGEVVDSDRSHRPSESFGSKLVLLFQNPEGMELTINDLLKSTNNFDQANIIGCGGFGLVYKAYLPDNTKAAIKRLSGDCGQMEREFRAEVEALSRAQHKNLVSLRGYCRHGNDRLLIYSYMENGSLDYWLHERLDEGLMLDWGTRLKIAQGSARGLAYLHRVCDPNIVHRDVKSSNILLNDKFEAHLADFGLSRLLRPYDTHVTTDLVGTLGYIPPEYGQTLTATFKGDVYSFGVVLLELLTGKRPVDVCKSKGCRDLVSWVVQMKREKKEEEIFVPFLWSKEHEKQLLQVLEIACKCIDQDPKQRPSIGQVVLWLDSVGDAEPVR